MAKAFCNASLATSLSSFCASARVGHTLNLNNSIRNCSAIVSSRHCRLKLSDESLSHLSNLFRQSRLASDSELESLRRASHALGNAIASCPIFPELRPILDEAFEIFGDKSEFVVAARQYCVVATIVPYCNASRGAGHPANRAPARVPDPCGLPLAWQFPASRSAVLPAGYRR